VTKQEEIDVQSGDFFLQSLFLLYFSRFHQKEVFGKRGLALVKLLNN